MVTLADRVEGVLLLVDVLELQVAHGAHDLLTLCASAS